MPLCTQYDDLRRLKLQDTLFPAGVLAMSEVAKDPQIKERSIEEAIPEFMRFNIVESSVYASLKKEETEAKDVLLGFEKEYPRVAKESNIDDILRSLKEKQKR